MKGIIEFHYVIPDEQYPDKLFTVDLYMHYSETNKQKDFNSVKIDSIKATSNSLKYVSDIRNLIFDFNIDISNYSFKYITFSVSISDDKISIPPVTDLYISILFSKIKTNFIPIYRYWYGEGMNYHKYYLDNNNIKSIGSEVFQNGLNNLISVNGSKLKTMKGTIEFTFGFFSVNYDFDKLFTVDLYMHYSETNQQADFNSVKIASITTTVNKLRGSASALQYLIFDIDIDITKYTFKYITFSLHIGYPLHLQIGDKRFYNYNTSYISLLFSKIKTNIKPIYRKTLINSISDINYKNITNDILNKNIFNLINVDSSLLHSLKGTFVINNTELFTENQFTVELFMHYSETNKQEDFNSIKIDSMIMSKNNLIYASGSSSIIFDFRINISKYNFKYIIFSLYTNNPDVNIIKDWDVVTHLNLLFE